MRAPLLLLGSCCWLAPVALLLNCVDPFEERFLIGFDLLLVVALAWCWRNSRVRGFGLAGALALLHAAFCWLGRGGGDLTGWFLVPALLFVVGWAGAQVSRSVAQTALADFHLVFAVVGALGALSRNPALLILPFLAQGLCWILLAARLQPSSAQEAGTGLSGLAGH